MKRDIRGRALKVLSPLRREAMVISSRRARRWLSVPGGRRSRRSGTDIGPDLDRAYKARAWTDVVGRGSSLIADYAGPMLPGRSADSSPR